MYATLDIKKKVNFWQSEDWLRLAFLAKKIKNNFHVIKRYIYC
ncbi:hypothetical protein STRDD12_01433 [Streptococcus sp. DD12]|nr:hypothetical protein STRDD12_01433 [Streptococcus sp. DD12]